MKTRVGSDRNRGTFTESVLAKGIRVNQLAKELGVESKAILAKCRDEGLGDKVPNHMSVLSLGLAETVREWVASGELNGGGVATAVETEAPPEVAVKPKRPRTRKKAELTDEAPREEVAPPSEEPTDVQTPKPSTERPAPAEPPPVAPP